MKELIYPFDAAWIIKKRKKIKEQLLEEHSDFVDKKIAILGGSTTSGLREMIELFLLNNGIHPTFYESEYNRYYEDAVFENPVLKDFSPDIVYVYTTNRNITVYPSLSNSAIEINTLLETEFQKFQNIWENIQNKYKCPIIQNNFEMPLFRLLGNKDASDIHGAINFLTRLNVKFYEYAQTNKDFFICDINFVSADYGLKEWSDPFYWYMYKYALNVNAIPYLGFNVAKICKSIFGKNKKGMVLDLDNTLWGGTIGDDGIENIKLGPEEPDGQVYLEFQQYISAHEQLGVFLAIDSKNDMENALAGLGHPDSVLRKDDFLCVKANWEQKDKNFRKIADEIGVLPESLVFIDDNPVERHIVGNQIRGVCTPDLGNSHEYIQNIDRNGFFEMTYFSKEDMVRDQMYWDNVRRKSYQTTFSDYGEFLTSLNMTAVIKPFETIYMERISQLTNKSNQFNLTTKRFTRNQLEAIVSDKDQYITLYGRLSDMFGDNGVVSVTIGRLEKKTDTCVCHIMLWLMSCRVLKRDMEFAMMDEFVEECSKRGCEEIRGYYYPTEKNTMVKDFYQIMGFEKITETDGNTVWRLRVDDCYVKKNKYIKVEE